MNCKLTRSLYQARYLRSETHVVRAQEDHSVTIGVSKSKKLNVAGQGQPKHLNTQPHGQYHALKARRILDLKRLTVQKFIND